MICALTTYAPFYDCDQPKWEVWIFDSDDMRGTGKCDTFNDVVTGCATFMKEKDGEHGDIEERPRIYVSNPGPDYRGPWGMTPIQHEIKHIQCRCNWHD